jgi:Fe-S cluster assembly ATP-binding protein
MLEVNKLSVSVGKKKILHEISLTVNDGETQVLFGPNGSGKTTIINTIMGFPGYRITGGTISFKGHDITHMPMDERARLGIGLSFQRPPVVRGVKTRDMVAICYGEEVTDDIVNDLAKRANLDDFLDRDINHGFSGGEIKRSEMMQLLAQRPQLVLIDEPESGVDLVNIALIGQLINDLLEKRHPMRDRIPMGLIITHTGHILDYVNARTGYVMMNGRIGCDGDPHEILQNIKENGYQECIRCVK